MTARLPAAPLWDWRDQLLCCICAPHRRVLLRDDWQFLWRLDRRDRCTDRQRERLARIVQQLEHAADERGIVWP
jgi:hypothetical protein